jgi:hypothetical protein
MISSISHRLYRQIILLYPEPFRREFGEEMLGVFDECQATQEPWHLFADGLRAALKQQLRYLTTPAPERTALYSEVASSPGLARGLATAVVAAAIMAGLFVRDERPKARFWPKIHIEHRIWYLQCPNATSSPKLSCSTPRKANRGEPK